LPGAYRHSCPGTSKLQDTTCIEDLRGYKCFKQRENRTLSLSPSSTNLPDGPSSQEVCVSVISTKSIELQFKSVPDIEPDARYGIKLSIALSGKVL
ncbi:hypothetical protein CEXT_461331, partial [Caerostris extrusa]